MSIGTRFAIAFVLGCVAAFGMPQPKQAAPTFVVEDVSDEMKTKEGEALVRWCLLQVEGAK